MPLIDRDMRLFDRLMPIINRKELSKNAITVLSFPLAEPVWELLALQRQCLSLPQVFFLLSVSNLSSTFALSPPGRDPNWKWKVVAASQLEARQLAVSQPANQPASQPEDRYHRMIKLVTQHRSCCMATSPWLYGHAALWLRDAIWLDG